MTQLTCIFTLDSCRTWWFSYDTDMTFTSVWERNFMSCSCKPFSRLTSLFLDQKGMWNMAIPCLHDTVRVFSCQNENLHLAQLQCTGVNGCQYHLCKWGILDSYIPANFFWVKGVTFLSWVRVPRFLVEDPIISKMQKDFWRCSKEFQSSQGNDNVPYECLKLEISRKAWSLTWTFLFLHWFEFIWS